jgi:splicing factor 3A subunit 1
VVPCIQRYGAYWVKVAFAEIDWHDYAIVQTIEFTAADANSELPAPMSVQEVENMTLAQKRMAAMVMETTAEDVEAHRARQAAAEAEAAAAVGSAGGTGGDEDATMEQSDDEAEDARRQEQGVVQRIETIPTVPETTGNIKIRTDYIPKRASAVSFVRETAHLITIQLVRRTKNRL